MPYKRILTGLLLAALMFSIIFTATTFGFLLFSSILFMFVMYEWGTLLFANSSFKSVINMTGSSIFLFFWIYNFYKYGVCSIDSTNLGDNLFNYNLIVIFVIWLAIIIVQFQYPNNKDRYLNKFLLVPVIYIVTLITYKNIIFLWSSSVYLLMHLILLVSFADVGAYIIGKCLGKHKLCVALSPGKTVEGALGGISFAVGYLFSIRMLGEGLIFPGIVLNWLTIFIIAISVAITSIAGDLFVSMVKRNAQIKNSGWFLPGHGGILDRLDSYLLATPVFSLLYLLHS